MGIDDGEELDFCERKNSLIDERRLLGNLRWVVNAPRQPGCRVSTFRFELIMASDALINLTKENFASEIQSSEVPVIVDFWAEWCGPCRMLTPILEQLATEKAGAVKIGKVNVDEQPELAAQFQVRGIPMLVFFNKGAAVDTVVGVQSKDALVKKLETVASAG
jgi:thioredoxin 1